MNRDHEHHCPWCGGDFTCGKGHLYVEGGQFRLHPACARALSGKGSSIRMKSWPGFEVSEMVGGQVALLAQWLGRNGGERALDVLAQAFNRERLEKLALPALERHAHGWHELQNQVRAAIARRYRALMKKEPERGWRKNAVRAMSIDPGAFSSPAAVRTAASAVRIVASDRRLLPKAKPRRV